MALAGELAKYIGGELVKNTGKELATKAVTSTLSNLAPKIATKAGASMANKIGNEMIAGSVLDKLVPTNRMLDKAGRPVTLYHSTPNNFDKFDDNMLGSNTGYDNTALGHFVTPDKDFSKRFIDIDNVGKTGRTMELQGNIQKPITHPYMAGYKYDNKDLDKIVEDYLLATDNPEFLDELRGYALDDNSNLYDEYMGLTMADSPFEVSGSDRQSLMNKGYDAVEIVEGPKSGLVEGAKSNAPVSSYAVFNGENLRPVRHIPISQVSNSEEVPVSTLRNLFRGQLYSDTDFSYNSPSMNSGDSAGSQALGGAYHFTPDENKANAWADNAGGGVIKIGYKPDQLLKAEDAKRMIQEAADKLNDGAYMSKLWQTDPELAEQIELVGIGNLEALAKREGKPFVEHINANDNELGTIYYYKDVDEGLTDKFREQFRKTKAEKYLGKPKVQQSLVSPDVRYDKGMSLTEMAKRINAMKASRESMADGVKRIGSADVAPVREETLPDGWKELEKYLDTSNDRLSLAIGKPRSKITKQDLINFLEDYGYDTEGTKDDLWKNALMCIDDMAVDDLYNAGGSAGEFLQERLPFRHNNNLTDATNYYIGAKGRTGRLDAEYSDRLGIGRSNTPMSDRLVNPYSGAGGDYSEGAFGTDATWANGESGVSTSAHERMHAWQDINKFDWDEEVGDAIDELRGELKKFYHDEDAIKKYWGNSKTDYYMEDIEQEARMLQSYLDNEGYTNTYRKTSEKGTEWGDEVKPAFDKFFKKLRALSKRGVALPAVSGLVGVGTLSGKKDSKKLDN